jgi:hypothetical protein
LTEKECKQFLQFCLTDILSCAMQKVAFTFLTQATLLNKLCKSFCSGNM